MQPYATGGPSNGKAMFYPLNPTTGTIVNRGSTANGYGNWFNASGVVSDYGNGYVYSEFSPASMTFSLGQYPNRVKDGATYKIGQALRYKTAEGREALVRFWFNIHINATRTGSELSAIEYADPTTGILPVVEGTKKAVGGLFTTDGIRVKEMQPGKIYIVNGRKTLIK